MNNVQDDINNTSKEDILLSARPAYPPPLYYLPKILTPAQDAFLARRRIRVAERVQAESNEWESERKNILKEIALLKESSEAARIEATEVAKKIEEADEVMEGKESDPPISSQKPLSSVSNDPEAEETGVVSALEGNADTAPLAADVMDQDEDAVEY
jgi:hypothetical protein